MDQPDPDRRRWRDAVDHIRAGLVCVALALGLVLTVPAPWNRMLCVGFVIAALTFAAVTPRPRL